jgi:hypothetical protein
MASTPLYKRIKSNGTTFYAFPGASEDISAAYQNNNYRMYFSKYILLNLPKQNLNLGTSSIPIQFDFENSFARSVNATPPTTFQDSIVESLRNYVANHEVVMRESRLNNTDYFYDTNVLETSSEKIFWKWCKKLNIIQFEPAIPDDEYFQNLPEFASRDENDDEYFPEILWKEREVNSYDTKLFYESSEILNKLEIEFSGVTNFKVGDIINIYNVSNSTYTNNSGGDSLAETATLTGQNTTILKILPSGATQGQRIIVDVESYLTREELNPELDGKARLVYNRLVQYIGEVNGVSNVAEANRSYTEIYAHIPDHTGRTPDILFRTRFDANYRPNLTYPVVPSQYQPEIMGSEIFSSPIVSSPQDYPGSYFGQFDTLDFTYTTSTGDELRRSGDYFGVTGDINVPITDSTDIDGLTVDFSNTHYVKMNIANRQVTNFDQFNALEINNLPPTEFEFNAILWYYTVENVTGGSTTNLYGITFLDNPDNNLVPDDVGLKFPTYKKLVANGQTDGTSFAFSLLLNFNIINDNPQDAYNPQAINALFSMNLFNNAMTRLASLNDSFLNILAENGQIKDEIIQIKGLLYTQNDLNTLNAKITSLENLLRLYSTNQIISSNSILANQIAGSPPSISLQSIDPMYSKIDTILTSQMYNTQGAIPLNVSVPTNKSFLISVVNNDEVDLDLPNQEKLSIVLSRDLDIFQTCEFLITATEFASQNKKLDIEVVSIVNGQSTEILLLGDIDLPVFFNTSTELPNSASLWRDFNFSIDLDKTITLDNNLFLEIPFSGNTEVLNNSIKVGDTLYLNNFFIGTASVYDFSGQYVVSQSLGSTSSFFKFDINSNPDFIAYGSSQSASLPLVLHGTASTLLSNNPYFSLNKGKKIKIYRINNSEVISERYKIEIQDIN